MLMQFLDKLAHLVTKSKQIVALLFIMTLPLMLNSCIVAAVGAGVAGGVYFQKHYKVSKTDKSVGIEKKEPQVSQDSYDAPPISKPYIR